MKISGNIYGSLDTSNHNGKQFPRYLYLMSAHERRRSKCPSMDLCYFTGWPPTIHLRKRTDQ